MCGKTTLAIALSGAHWRCHGMPSIVYDPFKREHAWGAHAWVTDDIEKYKRAVAGTRGYAVFWDESTTSMRKAAADDIRFFSQIRHSHPAFYCIGHDVTSLSPLMRGSLTEAYVFRQSESRAAIWVEVFADKHMLLTTNLEKREFVHKRAFELAQRRSPSLSELNEMKL